MYGWQPCCCCCCLSSILRNFGHLLPFKLHGGMEEQSSWSFRAGYERDFYSHRNKLYNILRTFYKLAKSPIFHAIGKGSSLSVSHMELAWIRKEKAAKCLAWVTSCIDCQSLHALKNPWILFLRQFLFWSCSFIGRWKSYNGRGKNSLKKNLYRTDRQGKDGYAVLFKYFNQATWLFFENFQPIFSHSHLPVKSKRLFLILGHDDEESIFLVCQFLISYTPTEKSPKRWPRWEGRWPWPVPPEPLWCRIRRSDCSSLFQFLGTTFLSFSPALRSRTIWWLPCSLSECRGYP